MIHLFPFCTLDVNEAFSFFTVNYTAHYYSIKCKQYINEILMHCIFYQVTIDIMFIFNHMKHAWLDYRNRMKIELVRAESKIKMNDNYYC
jgi:hypothetical protein